MESNQERTSQNNNASQQQGSTVPATEVALNPNPRANENLPKDEREENKTDAADSVGSEITDGEDA